MKFIIAFFSVYLITFFIMTFGGWAFGAYAEPLVHPDKHPSLSKYFFFKWVPTCAAASLLVPIVFVAIFGLR